MKKTALVDYKNIRKTGIIAISLRDDDELVGVCLTDGNQDILMATSQGMSIRFSEIDVRVMGRAATGVRGIQLVEDDWVIGMDAVRENSTVLVITTRGYGKRTSVDDYRAQMRGGKGYTTFNCTEKNGHVVAILVVNEEDDIMIITNAGIALRVRVSDIAKQGRNTTGVRVINVPEQEEVAVVSRVASEPGEE